MHPFSRSRRLTIETQSTNTNNETTQGSYENDKNYHGNCICGGMVAFGFGLLHGFGFANALRDLGLEHGQLALTLFGFNLGVEIGQLAIVSVFLPLALSMRRLLFYQRFILRVGSAGIILVASAWFAERALDFKLLP